MLALAFRLNFLEAAWVWSAKKGSQDDVQGQPIWGTKGAF